MSRLLQLSIFLVILSNGIIAQDVADSLKLSSFRKGRNLVGMSGAVSSTIMDRTNISTNPNDIRNEYFFDVKLGKFVANKNLFGLSFNAQKAHLIGYVETEAEVLSVGPWYRLYLCKDPNLAFYLQSTLHYASYYGLSTGIQNLITINDEVAASGINGSLGLGVCYAIADIITFEVGCDYHYGRFWGTLRDNTLATEQNIVVNRSKFLFSFGFAVLFGKLKEDD